MTQRQTPLPCLICGTEPQLLAHGLPGLEKWQVACPHCQTAGPVYPSQNLAVGSWNCIQRGLEIRRVLAGCRCDAKDVD